MPAPMPMSEPLHTLAVPCGFSTGPLSAVRFSSRSLSHLSPLLVAWGSSQCVGSRLAMKLALHHSRNPEIKSVNTEEDEEAACASMSPPEALA